MLLQSSPLTVTTNTITDSPSTAAQNIRNAIADGSLQAQLTPLGLSIVPGSLGTSNVSVHDPRTLNPKPGCAGKPVHLEYACVNARAILLLTRLGAVVWGVHVCAHVRLLLHLLHMSAHLHVCVSVMRDRTPDWALSMQQIQVPRATNSGGGGSNGARLAKIIVPSVVGGLIVIAALLACLLVRAHPSGHRKMSSELLTSCATTCFVHTPAGDHAAHVVNHAGGHAVCSWYMSSRWLNTAA